MDANINQKTQTKTGRKKKMEEFREDVTSKFMLRLWENSQFMNFSWEINVLKHAEKYKGKNTVVPSWHNSGI